VGGDTLQGRHRAWRAPSTPPSGYTLLASTFCAGTPSLPASHLDKLLSLCIHMPLGMTTTAARAFNSIHMLCMAFFVSQFCIPRILRDRRRPRLFGISGTARNIVDWTVATIMGGLSLNARGSRI